LEDAFANMRVIDAAFMGLWPHATYGFILPEK